MKSKNAYSKEIKEYFSRVRKVIFPDLTTSSIKSRCIYLCEKEISDTDKKIVENFFKKKEEKDLTSKIRGINSDRFKAILNYLRGITKGFRHEESYSFVAWLIDFEPRPYQTYLNYGSGNSILNLPNKPRIKENLIEILSKKYINSPEFNSIKINGDVDNQIGVLSMDDYYIQLSYTSYEDIYNRDSLLKLEKEYAHSKVYKSTINNRDLSQDYISENIISNDKVIISGNPGVGKSTYAKWFCFQWAKNFKTLHNHRILIYVQLRDLNFDEQNYLLNYINKEYLKIKLTALYELDEFQLILDGFDELTFENRIKLSSRIKTYNYIVLSRPYGLINHELNYDFSVQIDGFNSDCIEQYLIKIIKNKKTTIQLLEIIDKNRVLKDYSSTPLMLSYIVLIFLTSKSIKKDLSSIKSAYDLQEKVFSWILDYGLKKGNIKPELLCKTSRQIEEFAYLMQLNKQFVYSGSYDDKNSKTVEILSAIGLGSQKRISKNIFSWQYNFHTITFQEFLTARYLKEQKLNIEAIVYLVTDSFFWNLFIMLVGMLSHKHIGSKKETEHSELLINVLSFLYRFYSKHNHQYYGYAYYMLLAECSDDVIRKIIEDKDLLLMLEFYKKVYFDNFWNTIIYESIYKIIYKSKYQIQVSFIDEIKKELTKIPKNIERNINVDSNFLYLSHLIKIGVDYDQDIFIKPFMVILTSFKNKAVLLDEEALSPKYEDIENSEDEKLIERFSIINNEETWVRSNLQFFLNDLEIFPSIKLKNHVTEINAIYKEEMTSVSILKNVLLKIVPVFNLEELEQQYRKLLKFKNENSIVNNEKIQELNYNLILEFSENIFIVLNNQEALSNRDIEILFSYIRFITNDVTNHDFYNYINDFYLGHLIDVLIESITLLDSSESCDLLFNFARKFDATIFTSIPSPKIFDNYLLSIFNSVFKTLDLELVDKLIFILKSSPNVYFHFISYRPLIFKVFKLLIEQNKSLLEKSDYGNDGYEKAITILTSIAQIPQKNYDKKYFLEQINLNNLSFIYRIQDGVILKTITTNFIFYEDKYWKLFNSFFANHNWKIETILPVIGNEELFLFKSNHHQLVKISINLFENKKNLSKSILKDIGGDILVFISYILMSLKKFEDETLKHQALRIFGKVLQIKHIKKFCNYEVFDLTPVNYFLAYILFYFYNPIDKDFLTKLNIGKQLSKEVGAKIMLMEYLISFTENKNYGIEIHEIEKFKPILGDEFYQELLSLINQRLINKNKFDSKYFEMLIN